MRKYKSILICFILILAFAFTSCTKEDGETKEDKSSEEEDVSKEDASKEEDTSGDLDAKPVIYLYPEEELEIQVRLKYDGKLTCTYPDYNDGWNVIAQPDGTIYNMNDNHEYSYLFWEGETEANYDFSKGFVVSGEETKDFLQEKLAYIGLTPKEYNEFIVYWLPLMQNNEYNLISFQGKEYTNHAELNITPKPDSILRVFMAYKPLEEYKEVKKQELTPFVREGFTVVEWGGCCVTE